jgi:VIT1/CCC1 family predicted Fe2+/Mn2+ transporter
MKLSFRKGFSFGLTSAVITTLGLIVGLESSTNSRLIVISGILTIAVADAFSDALGIHVSEESSNNRTKREIWEATISTFLTKFVFALTFLVPFLFLQLSPAIVVALVWGFIILIVMSYRIGQEGKASPKEVITEHLLIATAVIIITYALGKLINHLFI